MFAKTSKKLPSKRNKTKYSLLAALPISLIFWEGLASQKLNSQPAKIDRVVECEILVAGGGLAGAAAAYEALLAGKTVCLTEIADWVGGQISSQGTSALDERDTQRKLLFYPRGYLEFRNRLEKKYGKLNLGECWVSQSCFLPRDGHELLLKQLQDAEKKGKGKLNWLSSTVIKELEIGKVEKGGTGEQIKSAIAIQHSPAPGAPPLNTKTLSQTIEDWYKYSNSSSFNKTIIRLVPKKTNASKPASWYVIDATETGELVGLTDVPYKLGIDPRSYLEPSSSSTTGDPYCTQGFTYTFAMQATKEPQTHEMPGFYPQYSPYYSYELKRLASFDLVFTYRRIYSPQKGPMETFGGVNFSGIVPGDISMQNWTWGNDYRPGTAKDNLVYTKKQLQELGQLKSGGWMGGLRTETLRKGEENALGYFYWLVAGTTDSQLGNGIKQPQPNNILLKGLDSPMGTVHGLSKYPYMREGRRIVGRPYYGYRQGFMVSELDISRRNYQDDYYRKTLSAGDYRSMQAVLAGLEGISVIKGDIQPDQVKRRKRSTIYPDAIGIGHYAIDFHPCMTQSPPEAPGNKEKEGERRGAGQSYPFQIPLRALIPQKIDNLLVAGKSIATSHIAAAAYRVHSFEWSSGAAAGITAAFSLDEPILPYQLVDEFFLKEKQLVVLQRKLNDSGNPTAFPDTSIFNESWDEWK
jgi:hypothetical protein